MFLEDCRNQDIAELEAEIDEVNQRYREVKKILNCHPDVTDQRRALYEYGLTYREIARLYGVSFQAVAKSVKRD